VHDNQGLTLLSWAVLLLLPAVLVSSMAFAVYVASTLGAIYLRLDTLVDAQTVDSAESGASVWRVAELFRCRPTNPRPSPSSLSPLPWGVRPDGLDDVFVLVDADGGHVATFESEADMHYVAYAAATEPRLYAIATRLISWSRAHEEYSAEADAELAAILLSAYAVVVDQTVTERKGDD
jgi:hypothetical protein